MTIEEWARMMFARRCIPSSYADQIIAAIRDKGESSVNLDSECAGYDGLQDVWESVKVSALEWASRNRQYWLRGLL